MFSDLRLLMPEPKFPIDVDTVFAEKNQEELGILFPDDYLAFGRIYGTGTIIVHLDGESFYTWHIVSPFCPQYPAYVRKFSEIRTEDRAFYGSFDLPLGIFPEAGGLLPFGTRDDLNFTWRTVGEPKDWTVVVIWAYDRGGYVTTELGFSDFLVQFLTRQLAIPGYEPWDTQRISFEPEALNL